MFASDLAATMIEQLANGAPISWLDRDDDFVFGSASLAFQLAGEGLVDLVRDVPVFVRLPVVFIRLVVVALVVVAAIIAAVAVLTASRKDWRGERNGNESGYEEMSCSSIHA